MPISDNQLAAILYFLLAIILPIALHFTPGSKYELVLFIGWALTGAVICFSLLTCPPTDPHFLTTMPTNDWITDRRPTAADGDNDGEVVLKRFADGRKDSTTGDHDALVDWRHVSEGVPWKHTSIRQPPATSEPEPTKPALAVGQRWRRRDGVMVTIHVDSPGTFRAGGWSYDPDGTAPFPSTGPKPELDLIELLTPTFTPRKFVAISRTVADFGHTIDAIDEDGVAWWMIVASDDDSESEWHQLLPLPVKEVAP